MNSITDQMQELIERYFEGKLSEKEKITFRSQLHNAEFREAVKFHEALLNVIEQETQSKENTYNIEDLFLDSMSVPLQLSESKNNVDKKEAVIIPLRKQPFFILKIAAGLLILVFSSALLWVNASFSDQAIVENFHEKFSPNLLMGTSEQELAFKNGKIEFRNGNFKKATELLERIDNQDKSKYYEAQCLLAFCQFELKKYDKAIKYFNKVIEKKEHLPNHYKEDIDKIRWSRMLAHIGNNQMNSDVYKTELEFFLSHPSDFYKNKADQLKQQLNNPWRVLVFD